MQVETGSMGLLRLRIFLLVAVPLAFPVAFLLFWVPWQHEDQLLQSAQQNAQTVVSFLGEGAIAGIEFEDAKALKALLENAKKDAELLGLAVYGADGKVLDSYGNPTGGRAAIDVQTSEVWSDGRTMFVRSPIRKGSTLVGAIQGAFSTERIRAEGARFRWLAVALSVAVLLLAMAMAFILGRGFDGLFQNLRNSIMKTASSVDEVVGRLAAVTAEQTSAASEESSALEETSSTANTVGSAAVEAADRASGLVEGGARAESASSTGLEAVAAATSAMADVRDQMRTIVTSISALTDRATAIGDIASTVAVLAERSNLLALNAAIEAARAGTQGRGFSVVAQEMRSLADGSNRSAGQVKVIIAEIQQAIARSVSEVKEGERRVQTAEQQGNRATESIRVFADTTREFAQAGKEIAKAAKQQCVAIEQIVESVRHATQAGSTQLETTRQVEETARELRQLSAELLQGLSGQQAAAAPVAETGRPANRASLR